MTKVKDKRTGQTVDTDKIGLHDPYIVDWKESGYTIDKTLPRHLTSFVPFVEFARGVDHNANIAQATGDGYIAVAVDTLGSNLGFALDKAGNIITLDLESLPENQDGEILDERTQRAVNTSRRARELKRKGEVTVREYQSIKGHNARPTTTRRHSRGKPKRS